MRSRDRGHRMTRTEQQPRCAATVRVRGSVGVRDGVRVGVRDRVRDRVRVRVRVTLSNSYDFLVRVLVGPQGTERCRSW